MSASIPNHDLLAFYVREATQKLDLLLKAIQYAREGMRREGSALRLYSNFAILFTIKATMQISDKMYREVKAKSALEGRSVRSVKEGVMAHGLGISMVMRIISGLPEGEVRWVG